MQDLSEIPFSERMTTHERNSSRRTDGRLPFLLVTNDRDRLGLSAKDYGLLVGVAGLTIHNWESGKARPRAKQLAAWGAVRRTGKWEALLPRDEIPRPAPECLAPKYAVVSRRGHPDVTCRNVSLEHLDRCLETEVCE